MNYKLIVRGIKTFFKNGTKQIFDVKIIFLFVIFIILSFVLAGKPYHYKEEKIMNAISKNFEADYEIDIKKINISENDYYSIIVAANDKKYRDMCENIYQGVGIPFMSKRPKIELFDYINLGPLNNLKDTLINPYRLRFSFEPIIFDEEINMFSWKKDDIWLNKVEIKDIDNDGEKEIITQWLTYLCGSIGDFYQIIFKFQDGEYRFAGSLPKVMYFDKNEGSRIPKYLTKETKIKNSINGNIYNISIGTTDDYIKFEDLDNDGVYELIFAQPMWNVKQCLMTNEIVKEIFAENHSPFIISVPDECKQYLNIGKSEREIIETKCLSVETGEEYKSEEEYECHFCPHKWKIGVYRYTNAGFIIDNNWNDGLIYITPQKIGLHRAHGWNELGWNLLGFMGFYYVPNWNPFYYLCERKIMETYCSCEDLALRDAFHLTHRGKSEILRIVEDNYAK